MLFGNVSATFGAAPSLALGLLSALYFIASLCVYVSLIYQISARTRIAFGTDAPARAFGLPEAVLASVLIFFFLLTISSTVPDPALQFHQRNLLANFLVSAFVVLVIATLLQFRGFDVGASAGFLKISFLRTLGTGAILLFFAYPLIGFSETMNQRFFGGGSSKQIREQEGTRSEPYAHRPPVHGLEDDR